MQLLPSKSPPRLISADTPDSSAVEIPASLNPVSQIPGPPTPRSSAHADLLHDTAQLFKLVLGCLCFILVVALLALAGIVALYLKVDASSAVAAAPVRLWERPIVGCPGCAPGEEALARQHNA